VTDGGAEENLGLISALYALESGLAKLLNGVRLRPIHVVIPEASGVSYDYSQALRGWLCSADRARAWRKTFDVIVDGLPRPSSQT
jgi:hypothetical protein